MEPPTASTPQSLSGGPGTAMRSAAAASAAGAATTTSSGNQISCEERPWSNGVHHHHHHHDQQQQSSHQSSPPSDQHLHNNNNNSTSHHYYRHQESQQHHPQKQQQQQIHYQQQLQPKPAHMNDNNNTVDVGADGGSIITMTLDEEEEEEVEEGPRSGFNGARGDVFPGSKPGAAAASSPQALSVSSTPEPLLPTSTNTGGESERGGVVAVGGGGSGGERGRGPGNGGPPSSLSSSLSPNSTSLMTTVSRTTGPHHHQPQQHPHPPPSSYTTSSSVGPRLHQQHHQHYPSAGHLHHHPHHHSHHHPQQQQQHYGATNPPAPSSSSSSATISSSQRLHHHQQHHPHSHHSHPSHQTHPHPNQPHHSQQQQHHHHQQQPTQQHHHHHQIHVVDNATTANNGTNNSTTTNNNNNGGASLGWGSAATNLRSPSQHQQQPPPPLPPQQQQQPPPPPPSSATLQPQAHVSAFIPHRSLDRLSYGSGSGSSAAGGGGGGGSVGVVGGGGGGGGIGFEPLPHRMPFEAQGGGGGGGGGAPPIVVGSKPPPPSIMASAAGRSVSGINSGRSLVVERARCAIGDPSAGIEKATAAVASAASNGGGGAGVAMTTSQPSNASELQLYNVLKRANLLQYYDTFIAQGGDDVQQLCEAGEDEFLEIMALVGMAAKPLHVRRLQKALQEWVANPAALEANAKASYGLLSGPAPGSISAVVRETVSMQVHSTQTTPAVVTAPTWTPQAPSRSISPSDSVPPSPSSGSPVDGKEDRSGSPMLQPVLMESQIQAIAVAAATLGKQLPYFQPKDLNPKRPINRDIQNLINSSESSTNKIEELRKYAAIYGRFDSKRKNDRPMSLHEISVNEAAAQLCLHCPALLTRREDLFPLARQVVRDSGYQYSKGHSRAAEVVVSARKGRLDPIFQRHFDTSFKNVKQEFDKDTQEERMSAVAQELASIRQHQEQVKAELVTATEEQDVQQTQKLQSELASLTSQQLQVLQEHSDLLKRPRSKLSRSRQNNGDDTGKDDASGTSSPIFDTENLSNLASATFDSLYAAIRSSKGTLFEEGLRIAQQYGMADFAVELQQLQTQRQTEGGGGGGGGVVAATAENGDSIAKVLEQPFELKEVKPGFDSGIGDDSMDGDVATSVEVPRSKAASPGGGAMQMVTRSVENGVQTVDTGTLVSTTQCKGDNKPDLKRKGDNLDSVPSRPPSRRSRSCQSGGVA